MNPYLPPGAAQMQQQPYVISGYGGIIGTANLFPPSPFERWRQAVAKTDPEIKIPPRDKSWLLLALPLAAGLVYAWIYFFAYTGL